MTAAPSVARQGPMPLTLHFKGSHLEMNSQKNGSTVSAQYGCHSAAFLVIWYPSLCPT